MMLSPDETELKTLLEHQLDLSKITQEKNISLECVINYIHKRTAEPRCLFLFRRWDVLNDVIRQTLIENLNYPSSCTAATIFRTSI